MSFWKRLTKSKVKPPPYEEAIGKTMVTEKDNSSKMDSEKSEKAAPRIPTEREEDEFDKKYDAEYNGPPSAVTDDELSTDASSLNAWQRVLNQVYSEIQGLERYLYSRYSRNIVYKDKDYGQSSGLFYVQFNRKIIARLIPKIEIIKPEHGGFPGLSDLQKFIAKNSHLLDPELKASVMRKGQ
ncbi:uncharacterized protein RJT21DRAFT_2267 [Scheffersomyces amazonensis]|uniref:uncharacterized protein n=1 Tax=Scheffersomyces amazonensis TaxID=1078765 RepID=UPI00315C6CC9